MDPEGECWNVNHSEEFFLTQEELSFISLHPSVIVCGIPQGDFTPSPFCQMVPVVQGQILLQSIRVTPQWMQSTHGILPREAQTQKRKWKNC